MAEDGAGAGLLPRERGRAEKKLLDAARVWASESRRKAKNKGGGEDGWQKFKESDIGAAAIDETPGKSEGAEDEEETFNVWRENGRALDAFYIAVRRRAYGDMGGLLGFDWQHFESQARMRKIKIDAELLDDLAVMEGGVLEILNAKP